MLIKSILAASALAVAIPLVAAKTGASTSQDVNVQRYSELMDIVFNKGNIDAADRYFQPDMVDHAPWPGHSADVAGFKAGLSEMRKSFPDLRAVIERTIAEDDILVAHFKISGSQLGDFMGVRPSGKTFSVEAVDIVRMTDGRIAEHWGIIDTAGMAEQLGL